MLCLLLALSVPHIQTPAPWPAAGVLPLRDALVIGGVGRYGRHALHQDAVEAQIVSGKWRAPAPGDSVHLPDGRVAAWETIAAGAEGLVKSSRLEPGYLYWPVTTGAAGDYLLDARGDAMVYVNGTPHAGDPYSNGASVIPVHLTAGVNQVLFLCTGGQMSAHLTPALKPLTIGAQDMTLPLPRAGERKVLWAAAHIINATGAWRAGIWLSAQAAGGRAFITSLPALAPYSARKAAFRIHPPDGDKSNAETLTLRDEHGRVLDIATVQIDVARGADVYRRTFRSDIDGSVQYYAVRPAVPLSGDGTTHALVLSLHGAGVEAQGQAASYAPKVWADIVCPTNRRPFGFDWEDWGRQDALEVLSLARAELNSDPARTYLTGHSMGGHGAWQLGVTFPSLFAATAPSAGWISFASYAGGDSPANPTPIQQMFMRASQSGNTLAMAHNLSAEGVYILHGTADDNVPPSEAREMARVLGTFHHDWTLFEQPGAGHWWSVPGASGAACVDWPPIFDLFSRRRIPSASAVRQIVFTTVNPGVSSEMRWLRVEQQMRSLLPSSVDGSMDPTQRTFDLTTLNVSRMALDASGLEGTGEVRITVDGQKVPVTPGHSKEIELACRNGKWLAATAVDMSEKNPVRYGPFKAAFGHRMQFVYGTHGSLDENAWAAGKARYDAETWAYRGNGSVDVLPDTRFDPKAEPDRGLVLYGNADTNLAWPALLGSSPVQVRRGSVTVGGKRFAQENLACLFLRPRPGSREACVAAVSGTGLEGLRLTERLPIFLSGAGFPDCTVLDSSELAVGEPGVRAAGFFGNDWGVESGEFVWNEIAANTTSAPH